MNILLPTLLFLAPAFASAIYGILWIRSDTTSHFGNWLFSSGLVMVIVTTTLDVVALGTLAVTGSAQTMSTFMSTWVLIPIALIGSLPMLTFRKFEDPFAMFIGNIFFSILLVLGGLSFV
jgi:cytochrome bd-type quinol oxidase subunit 2